MRAQSFIATIGIEPLHQLEYTNIEETCPTPGHPGRGWARSNARRGGSLLRSRMLMIRVALPSRARTSLRFINVRRGAIPCSIHLPICLYLHKSINLFIRLSPCGFSHPKPETFPPIETMVPPILHQHAQMLTRNTAWQTCKRPLRVRVQGSGCRVQGSEFRIRVQGSGFRVQGSGSNSGFRVQGSGFRGEYRFAPPCLRGTPHGRCADAGVYTPSGAHHASGSLASQGLGSWS